MILLFEGHCPADFRSNLKVSNKHLIKVYLKMYKLVCLIRVWAEITIIFALCVIENWNW